MKDKDILRLYRQNLQEYKAWLCEFPEIVHVLETLSVRCEGKESMNAGTPSGMEYCTISGLRQQLRKLLGRNQ